jgi:prepilin-type N-terminal cleavage/methylation domain-containing protein
MPTSLVGKAASSHPRHRARRGVTLVEMIVVVAIVGLIVGLTLPSATAGLDAVRMVSAADRVAAFLNAAENRSQRSQDVVQVVIYPQEGRFVLQSGGGGYTREMTLADGIRVEAVLPDSGDPDGPRRVLFMPGGTIPEVTIQLINQRSSRRHIRLDPMTGFPRIKAGPAGVDENGEIQ